MYSVFDVCVRKNYVYIFSESTYIQFFLYPILPYHNVLVLQYVESYRFGVYMYDIYVHVCVKRAIRAIAYSLIINP